MRKLFYTIFSAIIIMIPMAVNALNKPQSHGLSTIDSADEIVNKVIDLVAAIIASIAVLMIVVSGIMYITSGGDSTKTETAKKMLTYSVAGLAVALLAYVIVIIVGNVVGAW